MTPSVQSVHSLNPSENSPTPHPENTPAEKHSPNLILSLPLNPHRSTNPLRPPPINKSSSPTHPPTARFPTPKIHSPPPPPSPAALLACLLAWRTWLHPDHLHDMTWHGMHNTVWRGMSRWTEGANCGGSAATAGMGGPWGGKR